MLSCGLSTPGCHELHQWCSGSAQIITAVARAGAARPKAVQPGGHLYCKLLKSFCPSVGQASCAPSRMPWLHSLHTAGHTDLHRGCQATHYSVAAGAAAGTDARRCRRWGGGAGRWGRWPAPRAKRFRSHCRGHPPAAAAPRACKSSARGASPSQTRRPGPARPHLLCVSASSAGEPLTGPGVAAPGEEWNCPAAARSPHPAGP